MTSVLTTCEEVLTRVITSEKKLALIAVDGVINKSGLLKLMGQLSCNGLSL